MYTYIHTHTHRLLGLSPATAVMDDEEDATTGGAYIHTYIPDDDFRPEALTVHDASTQVRMIYTWMVRMCIWCGCDI